MRLMRAIKKVDYRHYICGLVTAVFLLSVYADVHSVSIFNRVVQSFKDFGLSVAYFFIEIFKFNGSVVPTVTQINFDISVKPIDFGQLIINLISGLALLFDKQNAIDYLIKLLLGTYEFAKIMVVVVPLVSCVYIVFKQLLLRSNNNYNRDTIPLRIYKIVTKYTIKPVIDIVKSFFAFLKANKIYYIIWLLLFAFKCNLYTILIEFFAYYFYFTASFDFGSVYTQFVKLFFDLQYLFHSVPLWAWIVIGLFVFDKIRKDSGYVWLRRMENRNKGFINSLSLITMEVGTMRKGKTTLGTDFALSQEAIFRDKAFELILENDLKFPYFPWINFENDLKIQIENQRIYNLATCKKYVSEIQDIFELLYNDGKADRDDCYGYDFIRYGLFYDDKLKLNYLFDVLSSYARLYFIYIVQSSLLISNYSIRVDNIMSDVGNFPIWNTDFFKRDSRFIDAFSRHAHILDFDSLRLGKRLVDDNQYRDCFEFGVFCITEIGKERGNKNDYEDMRKDDDYCNQKNDLFNYSLKLAGHVGATVDNYPFIRFFTDDQRPESWCKDARDLTQIIHIVDKSDTYLLMPFFFIEELLHDFVFSKFINLYQNYRYMRGDNCLSMYLIKRFSTFIHSYYERIYNVFSCRTVNLQIELGTMEGVKEDAKYYLMPKKIYSKRFSTDCYSDIFIDKALRSPVGLNDLPEYETEKASVDELKSQNSYVIRTMFSIKDGKSVDNECQKNNIDIPPGKVKAVCDNQNIEDKSKSEIELPKVR